MKKVDLRRGRKGFTIVELLVVIAIIIILMAFGFIAGMRLIRNMRQSHLDKRAEAVYYAAESRMMELFVTEEKTEKKEGEKVKSVVEKLYNAKTFDYEGGTLAYITSEDEGAAKSLFAEDNSLEAEIKSAKWIIEYDPVSLDVYAVILSDNPEKGGTSIAALSESPSSAPVRGTPQDRIAAFDAYVGYYSEGSNSGLGAAAKGGLSVGAWILNRRDLLGVIKITVDENTKNAIENLSFKISLKGIKSTTGDDTVDISSNEIYWQNYAGDSSSNFLDTDGTTGIVITTDELRNTIPASCFGDTKSNNKYGLIGYIKLDSLEPDRQFKNLKVKGGGTMENAITPGDDITMSVKVWDSGSGNARYSENVRSASATSNVENSLYADFDIEGTNGVARIVYPRHLQNLAYDFSKVKAQMAAGDGNPGVMDAVLLEDITWDEEKNLPKTGSFAGKVRNFTPITNDQLVSFNGYRYDSAKNAQPLRSMDDVVSENPEEVNLSATARENKYHSITGLRVDTSDSSYKIVGSPSDIGLFGKQNNLMLANLVISNFDIKNNGAGGTGMLAGELDNSKVKNLFVSYNSATAGQTGGSQVGSTVTGAGDTAGVVGILNATSVEDCVIKNISVKTTGGAAGALAGKATSSDIKNTLAYNGEMASAGQGMAGTTVGYDDSDIEITGGRNSGGLIGEMSGGSVQGSAAALYVKATGGNAGGFIGEASGASIDMCQSGGHTTTVDEHIGRYDKSVSENTPARVNVIGTDMAGGFVGKADSATIQNSYSTCSATAGTVGGFAGSLSGGNIATCYAVGQVFFTGSSSAGGFAGNLGGTGLAGNHYFEIINPTEDGKYLKGIGNTEKDDAGIKAIDEPLAQNETDYEYNKFILPAGELTLERQDKTHRYDNNLQPAIFGMPFCSQLKNVAATDMLFSEAHYGDWPIIENLVVNADASAKVRFSYRDPFATIKAFASDLGKTDIVRTLAEAVITEPIPSEDKEGNEEVSETSEQEEVDQDNSGSENNSEAAGESSSVEVGIDEGETTEPQENEEEPAIENTEQSQEPAQENAEPVSDTENVNTDENEAEKPQEEEPVTENTAQDESIKPAAEEVESAEKTEDDPAINDNKTDIIGDLSMLIETDAEVIEEESAEGCLVAEDKGISITFGKEAEIPEGSVLEVTDITQDSEDYDYPQLISDANEAVELSGDEIASYRALDIAIKYDGEEIQPKAPVEVEIRAENLYENNELFLDDEIAAVHIKSDEPEVLGTELRKDEDFEDAAVKEENLSSNEAADSVNFTTDGFSVYVLVQPIREKRVVATDNGTYEITVDYDNASGIPADAELVVTEVSSDTGEYSGYVEESARELGTYSEYVKRAKVFDISFVNPVNGDTYQPNKDVKVSVNLLQEDINAEEESVRVVHFGESAEVLDAVFNDGVTEFSTDGFSAYTILTLPTFDVFDTSLDGENYYIDYEDASAVKHYLSLDNTTSPAVLCYTDDISKATAWKFELREEGYKIGAGSSYITTDGTKWEVGTDSANRFTASDWGDYHLLCLAKTNVANKYIGYGTSADHLDVMVNSAAAHIHLTKAPGESDISDKSYNGRKLYVLDGGYFLSYTPGSAETKVSVPSRATEWTFGLGDHGYRLHNGDIYIGISYGKVYFTQAAKAAEFRVTDAGDYHLLEYYDKNASEPGYNGQFLYINNTGKNNQFELLSTDPANPVSGTMLQLVGDITITGDFVLYTKGKDNKRYAVSDKTFYDSTRGEMFEPVNISAYVNENTGVISENSVIKTIWTFEKTDTTFGHYIKIRESAVSPANVGKYLNLVWENNIGNLRLSDNPQLLYIYLLPDSRIRIVADDGNVPLALDYSGGGKRFQAYSKFDADADLTNVTEWFRISQVNDRKNYTVNYTYPKEKEDVGTRNNLPLADTEVVSGTGTTLENYVLKAPASTKYVSIDSEWKYTYEFVGWKIYGYTGTHEDGVYYKDETIDLTKYMEEGVEKDRESNSVVDIKAVWKLKKKEPLAYTVNYHMTDAEPSFGDRIDGGKLPDVIELDYESSGSLIATEEITGAAGAEYVVRNIGYKDSDGTYYSSYQEKLDPGGYYPNKAVRTYQRLEGTGDLRTYHTYLFMGWETETGEVLKAYDLDHVKHDLAKYDEDLDGVIDLKPVWSFQWENTINSNPTANLSILINAEQIDNPEKAEEFLNEDRNSYIHVGGAIMYRLDENSNPVMLEECKPASNKPYKYFMQYIIDENGVTRTEKDTVRADKSIRKGFAGKDGFYDDGSIDRKVHLKYEEKTGAPSDNVQKNHTWQLSYLPSDEYVFNYLKNESIKQIVIYNEATRKNEKINKSLLNADEYMIRWVVVKYQSADNSNGFHVNAKITKKISCLTVTKTIKGEAAALDALTNGIEEVDDSDSDSERNRKVEAAKNRFNITLKNKDDENEVLTLTLLDRVTNDVSISKTAMAKVAPNTFGYVKYSEKKDNEGKVTEKKYTWLVTFDGEKTFEVYENNYDVKLDNRRYSTELTYNQTNTGNSEDEKERPWDPEKTVVTQAEPSDNTDYDDNESTNFTNSYKQAMLFRVKKINDKKEPIKDVEFRVFIKGQDDPIRLYQTKNEADGNYSIFYENMPSNVYGVTNDDGYFNVWLARPDSEKTVYVIKETVIPEGYQGHEKYQPSFEVEIAADGTVSMNKEGIDMPSSYGSVDPYVVEEKENSDELIWTKKEYATQGEDKIAICNGAIVTNSNGVDVSLKKITSICEDDGKARRLAGAQFMFYDTSPDGDDNSLASVVDGSAKAYENVLIKNGNDEIAASVVTSTDSADEEGNIKFKIPGGIYFMKETSVPDKYEPDYYVKANEDPDEENNHHQYIYKLYVGEDDVKKAVEDIAADTGKTLEIIETGENQTKYVIVRMDVEKEKIDPECVQNGKSVIGEYGIINLSKDKAKVLLKKVDGSGKPLTGPRFDIYRSDGLRIVRDNETGWSAGNAGAFYIGKLSEGTYYLHEAPGNGVGSSKWFRIKVEKDSTGKLKAGDPEIIANSPFSEITN
ncbi:SpaA isopeptide-forming pilin-related protein [Butyrivibrio sp. JL13D10]|uniref:SpaA isopeptide-forming pilin-related protein n=1 Tax=Butyrivibrio sp. JL13D10 TaxID=3236815 RepID=UPI0038B4C0C2